MKVQIIILQVLIALIGVLMSDVSGAQPFDEQLGNLNAQLYTSGKRAFEREDYDLAYGYFKLAWLRLRSPVHARAAARSLEKAGRVEEALSMYDDLLARFGEQLDDGVKLAVERARGALLERQGRLDEALEHYNDVSARLRPKPEDVEWRAIYARQVELRTKLGVVDVVSDRFNAAVLIDGRIRGRLPPRASMYVMPGNHRLDILTIDGQSFSLIFSAEAGREKLILPPASRFPNGIPKPWTWAKRQEPVVPRPLHRKIKPSYSDKPWLELVGGFAIGRTLRSDAEGRCEPGHCSLVRGPFVGARFGWRVLQGLSIEWGVGLLQLSNRAVRALFWSEEGVTFHLRDSLDVYALTISGGLGYHQKVSSFVVFEGRFHVSPLVTWSVDNIGAHVSNAVESATAKPNKASGWITGLALMVVPEVRVVFTLRQFYVSMGLAFGTQLLLGPKLNNGDLGVEGCPKPEVKDIRCLQGFAGIKMDTAYRQFNLWMPQISAGYQF